MDEHRVFTLHFSRSDQRTRQGVVNPALGTAILRPHPRDGERHPEIGHYSQSLSGEEVGMQKTRLLRMMSAPIVPHTSMEKSQVKSWLDSNL